MKYLSIIEDFFSGNLKESALIDFILEIHTNPELRSEFQDYLRAYNFTILQGEKLSQKLNSLKEFELDASVLNDIKKYKEKMSFINDEKQLLSSLQSENKKYNLKRKPRFLWKALLKIAAIFILLIGLSITGLLVSSISFSNERLFKMFYSKYQHSLSTRSSMPSYSTSLLEGIYLYDNGNFKTALERFEEVPDSLRISDELYIIEGVCHIELGELTKALETLDKINGQSLIFTTALWYKGLCYFKLNDKKSAKKVFEELRSTNQDYQKKAKKVLLFLMVH